MTYSIVKRINQLDAALLRFVIQQFYFSCNKSDFQHYELGANFD